MKVQAIKGGIRFTEAQQGSFEWHVDQITDAWDAAAYQWIKCGELLLWAKEDLGHGQWEKMVKKHLPFSLRTAQKLMVIAADVRLQKATRESLPRHVATLYEMTYLEDATLKRALKSGTINADTTFREVRSLRLKTYRQQRHTRAAEQNLGNNISLWIADPPWQTSYELPYDTMPLEAIKSMRLGPDGRASTDPKYPTVAEASASHCAIGLWAVDELLHEAEEVLAAWGFQMLNPRIVWDKGSHARAGRAALMRHEYLLIGVRGKAEPTWLPPSVVLEPRAKLANSEKPVSFHAMLARMFPKFTNRAELFARRTPPKGWRGWGNQHPGDIVEATAA